MNKKTGGEYKIPMDSVVVTNHHNPSVTDLKH